MHFSLILQFMERDQALLGPIHDAYLKIEGEGDGANSYLRTLYESMESSLFPSLLFADVIVSIKKGEEGVNEKCAEVRALIDEVRKFLLPYEVKRVLEVLSVKGDKE